MIYMSCNFIDTESIYKHLLSHKICGTYTPGYLLGICTILAIITYLALCNEIATTYNMYKNSIDENFQAEKFCPKIFRRLRSNHFIIKKFQHFLQFFMTNWKTINYKYNIKLIRNDYNFIICWHIFKFNFKFIIWVIKMFLCLSLLCLHFVA